MLKNLSMILKKNGNVAKILGTSLEHFILRKNPHMRSWCPWSTKWHHHQIVSLFVQGIIQRKQIYPMQEVLSIKGIFNLQLLSWTEKPAMLDWWLRGNSNKVTLLFNMIMGSLMILAKNHKGKKLLKKITKVKAMPLVKTLPIKLEYTKVIAE
jgi:hypothetical protein